MHDELHAARLVEEALEHQGLVGRQTAERSARRRQIFDELLGRGLDDADLLDQPADGAVAGRIVAEPRGDLGAQARYRLRELVAAAGRLAEPERDGRRRTVRVLDPHDAALDALNAVRHVAELEDVTRQALDREV